MNAPVAEYVLLAILSLLASKVIAALAEASITARTASCIVDFIASAAPRRGSGACRVLALGAEECEWRTARGRFLFAF